MLNPFKPWYLYRPSQVVRAMRARYLDTPGVRRIGLPWGGEIEVDSEGRIGAEIIRTGLYDLALSEALWRLLRRGETAVDVGANVGYVTLLMAARTGRYGRVFAFEPYPRMLECLRRNVEQVRSTGWHGDVVVHSEAASDASGEAELYLPGEEEHRNNGLATLTAAGHGRPSVRITTCRLDEVLGAVPVGVMKVDVEDHEAAVFRGAGQLLRERRVRHVVYEDHAFPNSEATRYLQEQNYTVFRLGWSLSGPRLATADEAPIHHVRYEAPNFLATVEREQVLRLFQPRGWQLFAGRANGWPRQ